MTIKFGKYQAWIERTKHLDVIPHVERHNGATLVWFLGTHVIVERA